MAKESSISLVNPGHRERLEELHILERGQRQIPVQELVQRTLNSRSIEAVIFVLRIELASYLYGLGLLGHGVSEAREEINEIRDRETLEIALENLDIVELIVTRSTIQTNLLATAAISIKKEARKDPNLKTLLTQEVDDHLKAIRKIRKDTKKMLELPETMEFIEEFKQLQARVKAMKDRFTDSHES